MILARQTRFLFLIVLMLNACTASKYAATNKVYKQKAAAYAKIIKANPPINQSVDSLSADKQLWVGTVNMTMRKPNFVVLHHTAQDSTAQTIRTFTLARTEVSAHYVVGCDGQVVQMLNDYLRAHHAGLGKWGNTTDLNSCSIGIEIDNNGTEPYTEEQIKSLLALCATLKKRYNIPAANFIGHSDLAPKRKNDPANFPWKRFAEKGFGFWYSDILKNPPADFKPELALRIIGYDISNLKAAIVGFKRHFIQTDVSPELSPIDILVLYNLYEKYL